MGLSVFSFETEGALTSHRYSVKKLRVVDELLLLRVNTPLRVLALVDRDGGDSQDEEEGSQDRESDDACYLLV